MEIFFIILLSYMAGNISPSYFFARIFKKIDIRNYESGNAGTTNALRVLGKKMAFFVFLIDFFKGFITVFIVRHFFGMDYALLSALAVVLGHIYPIILGFRGGKGVATTLGVLYLLFTKDIFICSIFGIIILYITRYVSLAALITLFIVNLAIIIDVRWPNYYTIYTFLIFLIIAYKHKDNIYRLINKTERKLGEKKNKEV